MYARVALLLCGVVGSAVADYPQRQAPYNTGPNDPYSVAVSPNFLPEQSQRLFWGNQGSNQVGGSGLWNTLTNKFPFLNNMFGRMELSPEYGPQQQFYQAPQPQYYQAPQQYQPPQVYQQPRVFQQPQVYQQPQFRQFGPSGRDVGFTDDAIIVTPPQVPVQPPRPVIPAPPPPPPQPAPQPAGEGYSYPRPQPAPQPADEGYSYNRPQYRLELPQK
ncbi:hypothetical protein O0L34_g9668 [Tuta absoluta]|nr:hypothetical protein O0L34_g9668 [Tuta absoluta]